jgi:hypothetical protein
MAQRHLTEPNLNRIDHLWRRLAVFRKKAYLPDTGRTRSFQHIQRRTPLCPLCVVDLAKVQKLAFEYTATGAHTFNHAPIAMRLAVFQPIVTLQVHATIVAG